MASTAPPPPLLPQGWGAQWDEGQGRYYFYEFATSAVCWDLREYFLVGGERAGLIRG